MENTDDLKNFSNLAKNLQILETLPIVKQNISFSQKLADLKEKLDNKTFQLVVLGQYKRGKTSIINALLGEELLPVAIVPLTSIITILEYGKTEKIIVKFLDGKNKEIKRSELSCYITESENPKNKKGIESMKISFCSNFLAKGVQIIDTPGIGSVYRHNTDVAYEFVPKADAGLFIVTADPPIGEAELEFLNKIQDYLAKIIFVQNKIDQINEKERIESLDFTKKIIAKEVKRQDFQFFSISAKLALEGKNDHDRQKIAKSNIENLEIDLATLIAERKDEILATSIQGKLNNLLGEILLQLALQESTLQMSENELKEKTDRFIKETERIEKEKEDAYFVLQGQAERLANEILLEDIETLKSQKLTKLENKYDRFFQEKSCLNNRDFVQEFNMFLEKEIKEIFSAWRKMEEQKIRNSLRNLTNRFTEQTNQFIRQVIDLSANIFNLELKELVAEGPLVKEIEFKFSFDEYEIDIDVFTPIVSHLPKFISRYLFYPKMKEDVSREFDKHCGRTRYDFHQRILKSITQYQEKLYETLEETIIGIKAVLNKSLRDKEQKKVDGEKYKEEIFKQRKMISEIKKYV